MTDRYTPTDVRRAFVNYRDALDRWGIPIDGTLTLEKGKATYGRPWEVYTDPGRNAPPVGGRPIGATCREAYNTLTERTRAIHDIGMALNLPRHETTAERVSRSLESETS